MSRMFKAKVIRVETSLGVLIPKEIAEEEDVKEGEAVKIGFLREKRLAAVLKLMATAKAAKPFKRDRADRVDTR